jgi:hypothetical protein
MAEESVFGILRDHMLKTLEWQCTKELVSNWACALCIVSFGSGGPDDALYFVNHINEHHSNLLSTFDAQRWRFCIFGKSALFGQDFSGM